jgi:16S rRNA processing protein RimM
MDKYVQIGLITKPHGLRGEVCVVSYADSPFLMQERIFLQVGKGPCVPYRVRSSRRHSGTELLLLEGIDDRNAAEKLRQHKVLIPHAELPELEDDEVYIEDILGFTVVLDEDGSTLGTLTAFSAPTPEQEVWEITTPDGKEVLFPAAEEFVAEIDVDSETIRITPPPGLLEIYLSGS